MQKLSGALAKERVEAEVRERIAAIEARGETVRLALFRVGDRPDDCGYERSILRAAQRLGIGTETHVFAADVTEKTLLAALTDAAMDPAVNGMLLFRPLPEHLRTDRVGAAIPAQKDVDGTLLEKSAFLPCTPEACMRLLAAYGIDPKGKRCVVIGRSAVVGKPLAELLQKAGAVVTVCHTQTPDVPAETRTAELLFAACGKPRLVDRTYLSPGQIIVDVGFHPTETGVTGDVCAEAAEECAAAYTPVPGGVGAVTMPVMLLHTVLAHEMQNMRG